MSKKPEKIELCIAHWYDACLSGDEKSITLIEELPLQESVGRTIKNKRLIKLAQNRNLSVEKLSIRKNDECMDFPKSLLKSCIKIQLTLKDGFPETGERVVKVEV